MPGPMLTDDHEFVSEDDCILCGHWPAVDRRALREMLNGLPLELEQICAKCIEAFWTNCVAYVVAGSL